MDKYLSTSKLAQPVRQLQTYMTGRANYTGFENESSGHALPMMPRQNYLSKEEQDMRYPKQYEDIGIEQYQRRLLTNYAADPTINDDTPRDNTVSRTIRMNLREFGQPSSIEPWLNEVTLHDSAPDTRGSDNLPPMYKLKEHTFEKQPWIKANLFPDAIPGAIGGNITQFQEVDNKHAMALELKKRLIIFDQELSTYNPNRKTMTQSNDPSQTINVAYDQSQDTDSSKTFTKAQVQSERPTQLKFFSQTEPDERTKLSDFSQAYNKSYPIAFKNNLEQAQKNKDQSECFKCDNPQIMEYLTGRATNLQKSDFIGKHSVFDNEQDQNKIEELFERLIRSSKSMPVNIDNNQQLYDQNKVDEFIMTNQKRQIQQLIDNGMYTFVFEDFVERALKNKSLTHKVVQQAPDYDQEFDVVVHQLVDQYMTQGINRQIPQEVVSNITLMQFNNDFADQLRGQTRAGMHKKITELLLSSGLSPDYLQDATKSLANFKRSTIRVNELDSASAISNRLMDFQQNQDNCKGIQRFAPTYKSKDATMQDFGSSSSHFDVMNQYDDQTMNKHQIRRIVDHGSIRNDVGYEENQLEQTVSYV